MTITPTSAQFPNGIAIQIKNQKEVINQRSDIRRNKTINIEENTFLESMWESEEDHNRLHEQPKSTRILINSSREQTQDRFHEVGYKINKNYKWNPNSSKEILISDDWTNVLNFERPKTSQMATRSQLIGKDDLSKSTNSKTPTIALEVERNKTPNNENTSK